MKRLIATFLGAGNSPVAAGTFGSLAALPFAWVLHVLGGPWLIGAGALLMFGLGWWATVGVVAETGDPDPGLVVIDEVVGQWLSLIPLSAALGDRAIPGLWAVALGFVLFRGFDILKPGPIGWADRLHTSLGVMLDDVFAGIAAALVLWALIALWPGVVQ